MLWTFSPFVFVRKRFYTAVIWSRLLMVLVGKHLLVCSRPTDIAAALGPHAVPTLQSVQVCPREPCGQIHGAGHKCHAPHADAVCQSLRILSFSVTQLPAPNYHCRTPEPTAIKAMPEHWWGHFYIQNLKQQVRRTIFVGRQAVNARLLQHPDQHHHSCAVCRVACTLMRVGLLMCAVDAWVW